MTTAPPDGLLEPSERPPEGQTFVLEPRFDRPLHPLSTTTWLPIHSRTLAAVMRRFGLPVDGLDERVLLGRVYARTVPMLDRGTDGPPPPDWLMRLLFRFFPPFRRRLALSSAYDDEVALTEVLERWDMSGRSASTERTRELRMAARSAMSDGELADHLEAILEHVERVAEAHWELTFAGVLIPTGRLGLLVEDLLGWAPFDVVTLVQGYGEASTDHGRAIERLLERLGSDAVRVALKEPATLSGVAAVEDYLADHGHRVNVDLARATEAEDLHQVADHLRRFVSSSATRDDPKVAAREAERRALDALTDAADRARFESALALARRGRPYGDETEAVVLEALTLVRFVALEVARRLTADHRLERQDDVWYLRLEEIRAALRSSSVAMPDLVPRQREFAWSLANPAPLHLGPPPAPLPSLDVLPRRYRSTVGAVLWATGVAEATAPAGVESIADELHGEPASPGHATGTVRIIRDMAEFDRVQAGDIVVCPTTAAAWSPIFGVIAGLITEHGGLLSHPAILAREYGLPAVLGVTEATRQLIDGSRVEIDGGRGIITRL